VLKLLPRSDSVLPFRCGLKRWGSSFGRRALCAGLGGYSISQIYAPPPRVFTRIFVIVDCNLFGALLKGKSPDSLAHPAFSVWAASYSIHPGPIVFFECSRANSRFHRLFGEKPGQQSLPRAERFWVCRLRARRGAHSFWLASYSNRRCVPPARNRFNQRSEMLAMNFLPPSPFVLVPAGLLRCRRSGLERETEADLSCCSFAFAAECFPLVKTPGSFACRRLADRDSFLRLIER